MHDVTKRGLALAVATGGLLITGAAPAVSAVSTHPENPEPAGMKSQPTGDSSHHAAILVSGPKVRQYTGRHKAPEQHAAAPRHTAGPHAPAAHRSPDSRHTSARRQRALSGDECPLTPGTCAPAPGEAMPVPGVAGSAPGSAAWASDLGSGGLLTGNTVQVPIDAPANVCGVVATVLGGGDSAAGGQCVNRPDTAGVSSTSASAVAVGNPGALSGNVVQIPVSFPANICGDTATVAGGHDSAEDILCADNSGGSFSTPGAVAASSPGLASGNVVQVPVDAPVNVCGITAHVVGVHDSAAGNTCVNGGDRLNPGLPQPSAGAVTSNSSGAVTGNIVQVPIEAPINACGDSVTVVGVFDSALDNQCVNHTAGGASADGQAVGDNGLASGNVAQLPVGIPTEVCGVVAAVGAYHDTAEGDSCVNTGAPTTTPVAGTTGSPFPPPPPTDCFPSPPALPPAFPPPAVTAFPPPVVTAFPPPVVPAPAPPALPMPAPPVVFPPLPATPLSGEETGRLPHTGADVLDYAALGAGAMALGAGALIAARRRSGSGSAR